ncbi:MAG: hypothetical protein ACKVG0_02455 [Alphaproteobacteria bacterium]
MPKILALLYLGLVYLGMVYLGLAYLDLACLGLAYLGLVHLGFWAAPGENLSLGDLVCLPGSACPLLRPSVAYRHPQIFHIVCCARTAF